MAGQKKYLDCSCTAEDFTKTLKKWEKYDADGNGYIEDQELTNFLTDLAKDKGPKVDVVQYAKDFMAAYDKNRDGKIDMKELAEVLKPEENFLFLMRTESGPNSVEFKKIWSQYDADSSGFIEAGELKNFLRDVYAGSNNPLTDAKLDEYTKIALELYDKNADHKLDFNEMIKLLPLRVNYLKDLQFDKLTESDFKTIFAHYDKNKDNSIEGGELDKLLGDLLRKDGKSANPGSITSLKQSVMQHCDKNKDGKIQFNELALVLNFKA